MTLPLIKRQAVAIESLFARNGKAGGGIEAAAQ
jgi:hypothetical protein